MEWLWNRVEYKNVNVYLSFHKIIWCDHTRRKIRLGHHVV
jgi:hypothetical protein